MEFLEVITINQSLISTLIGDIQQHWSEEKDLRPTKRNIPTTLSTFLKYFTPFKLMHVREVPPVMTIQS